MTAREVEQLPASEYLEWIEYRSRVPSLDTKVSILLGELIALTANINRNNDLHPEPFELTDFMPWLHDREEIKVKEVQETTMQTKQQLEIINLGMSRFLNKLGKVQ